MDDARELQLVLGVDGGNSKTDVVLADTSGRVLAEVTGPGSRPHIEGMAATVQGVTRLVAEARRVAALPDFIEIACGAFYLANLDTEAHEASARWELVQRAVCGTAVVGNDTLAVLRAGTADGWGVALVSGAGVNAVGRHPDGHTAGFLALGSVTGDWGGAYTAGLAGLVAAVRAGDGRGPGTVLRERLPLVWGVPGVEELAVMLADGGIPGHELHLLAPAVFAAAEDGDAVAVGIVAGLAREAVVMVTALLRRLGLLERETPVVLAGGVLREGPGTAGVVDAVRRGLAEAAPHARPVVLDVRPVAGAVLAALDAVGAPASAGLAVRAALRRRPSPTEAGDT